MSDGDDRKSAEAGLRALQPRYARLETPVVIVVGEQDRMVPPSMSEKLHALLPRAEIVRLPASGHMPQFTDPGAVLAAVDHAAELAGVWRGARAETPGSRRHVCFSRCPGVPSTPVALGGEPAVPCTRNPLQRG